LDVYAVQRNYTTCVLALVITGTDVKILTSDSYCLWK